MTLPEAMAALAKAEHDRDHVRAALETILDLCERRVAQLEDERDRLRARGLRNPWHPWFAGALRRLSDTDGR